ncbi:MAG: PAS domain-containing protein [Myxococcales bacterium]|nr:PAS domain-containing protein [Myxococcales bacterium]
MIGSVAVRTAALGAAFGVVAALLAWTVHLLFAELPWTVDAVIQSHVDNRVLWLADLSPLCLALFGAWLGRYGDAARQSLRVAEFTEERLQASSQYQAILSALPAGALWVDPAGTVVEANPAAARIFASELDAVVGRPLAAVLPGFTPDPVARPAIWLTHDALGQELQVEIVPVSPAGHDVVVYLLRDVTEDNDAQLRQRRLLRTLVDARDRADASDQTRQRFLAGLAHELRTPLASMRGYLEIIAEEVEPEEPLQGFLRDLDRVRTATEQVVVAVEKVHDQAMAEAGEHFLYLVAVPLTEVFDEVTSILRTLVRPSVSLSVQRPDPELQVRADRQRLHQVLLALGSRACNQAEHGEVTLTTGLVEDSDHVRITLSDTGPGIPGAELKTLFSPYVREGESGDVPAATSHELITLMEGTLQASSQPGRGTTFELTLPRTTTSHKEERRIRPRGRLGRGRVLLVSEDRLARGLVEAGLGARGTQVLAVHTLPAALQAAEALAPSALMVDLTLRTSNPFAAMRILSVHPALQDHPVLGIALDRDNACLLPLARLLSTTTSAADLAQAATQVGHPSAPVLLLGGSDALATGLESHGLDVLRPDTLADAEGALPRAGLLVVDLMAQAAHGLSFAMDLHTVPVIGLLPPTPSEAELSNARRVVAKHLRNEGSPVEKTLEAILRRIGTFT